MNRTIGWIPCLLLLLSGTLARGQEKTSPKEITVGVIRITLNSQYAMLELDGKQWENSYFEEDGSVLIIENVDRTVEHTLKLTPVYEELEPAVLKIHPRDWKLRRVSKRARQWRVEKKVKFRKRKSGKKEKQDRTKQNKRGTTQTKQTGNAKKQPGKQKTKNIEIQNVREDTIRKTDKQSN